MASNRTEIIAQGKSPIPPDDNSQGDGISREISSEDALREVRFIRKGAKVCTICGEVAISQFGKSLILCYTCRWRGKSETLVNASTDFLGEKYTPEASMTARFAVYKRKLKAYKRISKKEEDDSKKHLETFNKFLEEASEGFQVSLPLRNLTAKEICGFVVDTYRTKWRYAPVQRGSIPPKLSFVKLRSDEEEYWKQWADLKSSFDDGMQRISPAQYEFSEDIGEGQESFLDKAQRTAKLRERRRQLLQAFSSVWLRYGQEKGLDISQCFNCFTEQKRKGTPLCKECNNRPGRVRTITQNPKYPAEITVLSQIRFYTLTWGFTRINVLKTDAGQGLSFDWSIGSSVNIKKCSEKYIELFEELLLDAQTMAQKSYIELCEGQLESWRNIYNKVDSEDKIIIGGTEDGTSENDNVVMEGIEVDAYDPDDDEDLSDIELEGDPSEDDTDDSASSCIVVNMG